MRNSYTRTLVRCSWIAIFAAGCQAGEERPNTNVIIPPPALAAVDRDPTEESNDEANQVATDTSPADEIVAGTPSAAARTPEPIASAADDDFVPPFPDRVDLFVPPNRAKVASRDDNGYNESVELKGFVSSPRLAGEHVLLAIDGVESPIAAGDEKYGVKVISIQRPSVVLQRGRNRWTETLE